MEYKFGKPINEYPNHDMYNNYNYNIVIIPNLDYIEESNKWKIYGKN